MKVPENGEPGQIVYFTSPSGQQLQAKARRDFHFGLVVCGYHGQS